MKREKKKIPQFVRGYRILRYLQKNTDEHHYIIQAEMRKDDEMAKYMGTQDTYNDLIFALAEALNCDASERILPQEEWQIMFDHYKKENGDWDAHDPNEQNEEEFITLSNGKTQRKATPIRNLYYRHIFSYEEIDALIAGIRDSKNLSDDAKNRIVKKIKDHLTSKHYQKSA